MASDWLKRIKEKETEDKIEFENFLKKNKDSAFMSNLLILRMRFFHYKELLKVFAMNYKDEKFGGSRNSVLAFMVAPSVVAVVFNIASPFSILRPIGIYGTFGASFTSIWWPYLAEETMSKTRCHPSRRGCL